MNKYVFYKNEFSAYGLKRVNAFTCLAISLADAHSIARAGGHDPATYLIEIDIIHEPRVSLYFDWADKNIDKTVADFNELKKKYQGNLDITLSQFEIARYNKYVNMRREEIVRAETAKSNK